MITLYEHQDGRLVALLYDFTGCGTLHVYRQLEFLSFSGLRFADFCEAALAGEVDPDVSLPFGYTEYAAGGNWGLVAIYKKAFGVDLFSGDVEPGHSAVRFIGPDSWWSIATVVRKKTP
jgi:hypothetical protein